MAQRSRPEQTDPEIRRVDLAGAVLQLLSMGENDVLRFPWLEPPPEAAVLQALALLRRLEALDEHGVTELGRIMARLPVHPRLGRLLIEGQHWGVPEEAALAAAFLSERDPFTRPLDRPLAPAMPTRSDLLDRLHALAEYERTGRADTPFGTLHRYGVRFLLRARDQLLRSLRQETRHPHKFAASALPPSPLGGEGLGVRGKAVPEAEGLLRALLAAFPDRLARRREPGSRRGVMVGGRGVRLAPSSGVVEPELFLCLDVDASQTETLVRLASAVQRDWLPPQQTSTAIEVSFDAESERVTARKRLRFLDLVLEEMPAALPGDDQTAPILMEAAAARWSACCRRRTRRLGST